MFVIKIVSNYYNIHIGSIRYYNRTDINTIITFTLLAYGIIIGQFFEAVFRLRAKVRT